MFNRPETTARVFDEIRRARPSKLFLIADGPRAERAGEAEKCRATRAVAERVDWDCEVLTNFSDVNLGCQRRPVSGLDWVFENVTEAIILEDDCLPHPTFFSFCEQLLEKYRDDERVMAISGNNFQFGKKRTPYSYYFSRYPNTWGWATWRRAWRFCDLEMRLWPLLQDTSWLLDILGDEEAAAHWHNIFARAPEMKSVWDYQWLFACWTQSGLGVAPEVNLVSNIGFGEDSTHTAADVSSIANLPLVEMSFPLQHPPYVLRQREADDFLFQIYAAQAGARPAGFYERVRRKLSARAPARMRKLLSD